MLARLAVPAKRAHRGQYLLGDHVDLRLARQQAPGLVFCHPPASDDEAAPVLQYQGYRVDPGVNGQSWLFCLRWVSVGGSHFGVAEAVVAQVLVVAEYLQLDGQVDLADRNVWCHVEHRRCEIEHRGDARRHQPVSDVLRRVCRSGDECHRDVLLTHDVGQIRDRVHDHGAELPADLVRVCVERGDDVEPALGEATVVAQGLAQVARPDDGDVVLVGEPELSVDLLAEQLGVVADPTASRKSRGGTGPCGPERRLRRRGQRAPLKTA